MKPIVLPPEIRQLLATPGLPELGSTRRPDTLSPAKLRTQLKQVVTQFSLNQSTASLLESALLLWHDHLDESHTLSQDIHNADGSFLHAIMHRREPDASNSKYWWRRVANHGCFPELSEQAGRFLEQRGQMKLAARLLPEDRWDPYAFVDACEEVRGRGSRESEATLRELQRIEMEVFLDHLLA